jgi:hypothetical protein
MVVMQGSEAEAEILTKLEAHFSSNYDKAQANRSVMKLRAMEIEENQGVVPRKTWRRVAEAEREEKFWRRAANAVGRFARKHLKTAPLPTKKGEA